MQGQMNHPHNHLTAQGKKQARRAQKELVGVPFAAIYSSDLIRAVETAEVIARSHVLPVIQTGLLRERGISVYEGQAVDRYMQSTAEDFEKFLLLPEYAQWRYTYEGSHESDRSVLERMLHWIEDVTRKHLGQTVLGVSHGGPLRMLLAHLGYASYRMLWPGTMSHTARIVINSTSKKIELVEVAGVAPREWTTESL